MLQQGLHLEVILNLHLDGLRLSSEGASRDVLLQLGHIEDIVDLLEPALEVKPICCSSYEFHYPEWSHISCPELPSTCKMEGLRGQRHLFSY